jgi:hypothetical protein
LEEFVQNFTGQRPFFTMKRADIFNECGQLLLFLQQGRFAFISFTVQTPQGDKRKITPGIPCLWKEENAWQPQCWSHPAATGRKGRAYFARLTRPRTKGERWRLS